MGIFKKLAWFFKEEKKNYFIGVSTLVLVAIIQLIPPRIIGMVVDSITNQTLTSEKLILWLAVLVVSAISVYGLRYLWRKHIWGGAARLEKLMRKRLFHQFTKMDQVYYQKY